MMFSFNTEENSALCNVYLVLLLLFVTFVYCFCLILYLCFYEIKIFYIFFVI